MVVSRVAVTNPKMVDARRRIRELNLGSCNISVQEFEIMSDAGPLGKYAHARKYEVFFILIDGGELLTAKVDQEGNRIGEIERFELGAGHAVLVEPYEAHTFYLGPEPGRVKMICFSYEMFNEKNPDFIPCPWLVVENLQGGRGE